MDPDGEEGGWTWNFEFDDYLRLRNWTRRFPLAKTFEIGDGTTKNTLEAVVESAQEWESENEEEEEDDEEKKELGEDVSLDFERWSFLNAEGEFACRHFSSLLDVRPPC